MEVIKIFVNGKPEGIMAESDPEKIMDIMLDELSNCDTKKLLSLVLQMELIG